MGAFKEPHGGVLKELFLGETAAEEEKLKARDYKSWDLTQRQLCDIELILNGAFSPLDGFLIRQEYENVLTDMRLTSGLLWPIPITLDVKPDFADKIGEGETINLCDQEGVIIATMEVQDLWTPHKALEAAAVFGTEDVAHPGVDYLMNRAHEVYVGGKLRGVEPPVHYDFRLLRDSPSELRGRFRKLGWRKVVAFQTRNPSGQGHSSLICRLTNLAPLSPHKSCSIRQIASGPHGPWCTRPRTCSWPGREYWAAPPSCRDCHLSWAAPLWMDS